MKFQLVGDFVRVKQDYALTTNMAHVASNLALNHNNFLFTVEHSFK